MVASLTVARRCAFAALVVPATAAALSAQTLTFTRQDLASFAGARGIAAADFDRNGWADLAHANTGRNTVTILLNQGPAQSFVRAHDIAVGLGPFDLCAGDFNRDGIPDLAVANADAASVSILIGRATGGFSRTDIAVAAGPRALVAADFNEDGRLDLVVTSWGANRVQVYYGNGAGAFAAGPGAGTGLRPQGLAVADFNHDGNLDIVIAHESSAGLVLFTGTASHGLIARPGAGGTNLNVLATGDFDRDGWPDVAAASTSGNRVFIYEGGATGPQLTGSHPVGASPRGIIAQDVTHDGVLELITANRTTGTISVLAGNSESPGAFEAAREFAAGSGSRALVAADFDRDGRLDLATANQSAATATVLWNETAFDRAGFSFERLLFGTPSGTMGGNNQAWPADFNEDGKLDILTQPDYTVGRQLHVLITDGPLVPLVYDHYFSGFAVADFNNDFHADVFLWQSEPFLTTVFLGNGRGGFTKAAATTGDQRLWTVGLGDLNHDGRVDLAFGGYDPLIRSYIVQIMLGVGNGTFRPGVAVTSGEYVATPTIVDVNRDGKADLAASVRRELVTWFGNGTGALVGGWAPVDGGGESLAFGDVNHDGFLDAVAASSDDLRVSLGGASGFAPPAILPGPGFSNWRHIAIADITMDGHPDIAGSPGFVIRGRGDGTFEAPDRFDFEGVGLHVADFTRDGLPDLLMSTTHGEAAVIANERNSVNHAPVVDAGPDLTFQWTDQLLDYRPEIFAVGSDPDLHALTYEWRDQAGNLVAHSYERWLEIVGLSHGTHTFTITVRDGRGGTASDSMTVTITPTREIVVWAANGIYTGNWSEVADTSAAGEERGYDRNLGAPKVLSPSANPASRLELQFTADPTQTYKLWVRLKADGNHWSNDSVWVQFTGSTDASGNAKYRYGTASGLAVNLEECSGCGISGWGWEDDGWGAIDRNGVTVRFPEGGYQRIVVQTREDGVSIDQVVLSAEKYLTRRPGTAKNDHTILRFTFWRDES